MLKYVFLLGSILGSFFCVVAQDKSGNSIEFSPQASVGVFTAQHKLTGTAYGGEILYHFNTQENTSPWMQGLNLKSIDLVFNYKNMSDIKIQSDPKPGTFGNSYALLAGLNISLLKFRQTELLLSPAFGLGYLGETYFTNTNPLIGSHINFGSRISLKATASISPSTQLAAGVDVLHYSNAAFRVPNNGINSSSISLSIIQQLKVDAIIVKKDSLRRQSYKKHSVDLGINIGRRGVYQSKEGRFRTGLYAGYNYRLGPILGLSSGIDAVYYHSVYDPNDNAGTYQSFATSYDHWRLGSSFGTGSLDGKFGADG